MCRAMCSKFFPSTAAQNMVSVTEHKAWTSWKGSSQIHINPLPSCAPAHCIPERQAAIHSTSDSFYRINQSTQWGLLLSKGPCHLELWWTQGQISPVHLVLEEGPLWGQTELCSVWGYDESQMTGGGLFTVVCRSVNNNLFDLVSDLVIAELEKTGSLTIHEF